MEEKFEISTIVIFPYADQMQKILAFCHIWRGCMEKTLAELSLLADAIATAFGPVVDAINDFIEMIASDDCDNCEEKENWPKNQRIGIPRHSPLSHRMRIAWYTGGFL